MSSDEKNNLTEQKECSYCHKDFSQGVKAAYKLGLLEGQNRFKHSLNCLEKTCKSLSNELIWLDHNFPLPDAHNVVIIKRLTVKRLVEMLKLQKIPSGTKSHFRKYLKTLIKK